MRKRVLFLIDSLGGGGAEKVLVNLVNNMNTDEFDITVETMFSNGINAEKLSDKVRLFCRKAPFFRGISRVFRIIPDRLLYRYFIGNEKYDCLIAYMHGAPAKVIAGCRDKKIKKFAWIHTKIAEGSTVFKFYSNKKDAVKSYGGYDRIIAVSDEVKKKFDEETGLSDKTEVIYNTNDVQNILRLSEEKYDFESDCKHICTLGRLSSEKGFDRLVRIAGRLKKDNFKFDIHILGEGTQRNDLERLIAENDVDDTVFLDGFTNNPYRVLARSYLFVCSSFTEGLSTALSEAVILGIPCVSTDVSGAKEVLGENNEYGIVTENDENSLYECIKTMLESKELYNKYKEKVAERRSFFDVEKTVGDVEKLLR